MVQQPGAPRFGVFLAGVIASPFLQHTYPAEGMSADSIHLIGEKDRVQRVSGPDQAPLLLQEQPPLKFIVCIGGVIPAPSLTSHLLLAPIPVPSLHILGDRDYIREVHSCLPLMLSLGCCELSGVRCRDHLYAW